MRLVVLVVLAALAACGDPDGIAPETSPWTEARLDALSEPDRARLGRAREAAEDLGRRLKGRLLEAVEARGLDGAIDVCREAAPAIASEVARARGVRLGRTSRRLRNAANEAPSWARAVVASTPESASGGDPRLFDAPDGTLGVLLPIRFGTICAGCHGEASALGKGVAERLGTTYPEDRARGYAPGELRGWFWVEVPAGE
jgi:hypothetical protein